jgi:RNA polymerase sigma-70 factor (ECF subfamily)
MNHPEGFHDLIACAQAGDQQALERLLTVIRPWVEELARPYADPEHPERSTSDLAQEACLRAWQKLCQFHGTGDDEQTFTRFRAWVGKIVTRLGLNAVRHREAQHRKPPGKLKRLRSASSESSANAGQLDPPASEPTPSSNAAGDEQMKRVQTALEKIEDSTDREIVRLRFFEGLSLRKISDRMETSPETVRKRYHAALKRLEHELEGLR